MEPWVILSGDEYVIHIDNQPSFGYFWGEDCIHHCLKGCWGICQPEEHYSWFKQPLVHDKCCLVLVSLLDAYIVVSSPDIDFSEYFCILNLHYEFRDQW